MLLLGDAWRMRQSHACTWETKGGRGGGKVELRVPNQRLVNQSFACVTARRGHSCHHLTYLPTCSSR